MFTHHAECFGIVPSCPMVTFLTQNKSVCGSTHAGKRVFLALIPVLWVIVNFLPIQEYVYDVPIYEYSIHKKIAIKLAYTAEVLYRPVHVCVSLKN